MATTVPADQTVALPRVITRRRALRSVAAGAEETASSVRAVPGWEWGLAVVTLFMLSRTSVLFYRERIADLIGAPSAFPMWLNDTAVRVSLLVALGSIYILAARRCDHRDLLREPLLLAFLLICVASISWSIEPVVSVWRVTIFVGTAVMGFYLGTRYTARELVGIVGAACAIGAIMSLIAAVVWPGVARYTNRLPGHWSGVYLNRNLLGIVMVTGLLTLPFLWATLPRNRRPALIAIGLIELFLMNRAGGPRTSQLGLLAAAAVGLALVAVRRATTRSLKPFGGAFAVGLVTGYIGLIVQWNWETIVHWLGRRMNLSKRTLIWSVDSRFSDLQPWKGWGFEALWSHPPAVSTFQALTKTFPYSSHSGYYEVLLSTGRIGVGVFVAFLVVAAWRAFRFAWDGLDSASIWPLTYLVFAAVANASESLFVSGEAVWALTVAAAVSATRAAGRRRTLS
jgi:uncharacterized membrane protein